jgi:hypothetical protein
VANGPDRVALGKSYYDTFATQAKGNFDRAIHDATSAAAAHGQIGSGQLTNRYGDLTEAFNRENTGAASDFATHALEGTIGDRLNTLGAARGAENSIYGQEANARNELRGERGYQQSLAEQAIAQRIAQNQMEQGQQAQDFGQAATIYGLGNQGDPTGAYQDAATLSSSEAGANSATSPHCSASSRSAGTRCRRESPEMAGFGSGLAHALTAGLTGYSQGEEENRKQLILLAAQRRQEERQKQQDEIARIGALSQAAQAGLDVSPRPCLRWRCRIRRRGVWCRGRTLPRRTAARPPRRSPRRTGPCSAPSAG